MKKDRRVKTPYRMEPVVVLCLAAVLLVTGCDPITQDLWKTDENRLLAPDQMVRPPGHQRVSLIKTSISMADVREDLVPNATPPTPEDTTFREEDYVIGPTDVLDISIMDLFSVGAESMLRREVSDAGYIDLPLLPERIKAQGLAQEGLKDAIKKAYSPGILRDPIVSISVVLRKQNTFSILGSVVRAGTYNLLRKDMRLYEALAIGGDVTSYNVKYVYVIRQAPATTPKFEGNSPAPAAPGAGPEDIGPLPTPITPSEIPLPKSAPATPDEMKDLKDLLPGAGPRTTEPAKPLPTPSVVPMLTETSTSASASAPKGGEQPPSPATSSPLPFIYSNGRWIRVEPSGGAAPTASAPAGGGTARAPLREADANALNPFEQWLVMGKNQGTRVIAVNFKSLMNGDRQSNIVIRDNDVIYVPRDTVGEFYVMGEVARPGVYSLSARNITVKMAVAAAGNLNQTAWPQNSILIRRVGENQEQVIPLDVEAIFFGQAPDMYLKPDDVIAVGSSWRQPNMAVLRNAFRFSYGFGFVYDRNFDSPQFGETVLNSKRFTRW
jgi:protein involved in polysaccharide export with SLBB domain